VVAAAEKAEEAGNEQYQDLHMNAIFKEGFSFSGFERDRLALSLGGKRFLDISGVSGVDSISDGRGALFADLDNDGDLDIFLTAVQREAHYLFRNNVGSENRFLRVELEGTRSGRDAFGAVVRVKSSAGIQTKIKAGGSGFLSQNDPRLLFGLGKDHHAEWVEITWPSGAVQKLGRIGSDTSIKIVEGREDYVTIAEHRFQLPDPLSKPEALMARLGLRKGDPFPDVTLRAPEDDREIHLGDLFRPGRRYLVNLWATYCIPCREEMPELQKLYPRFREMGIELLGVSIDVDTVDRVQAFLEEKEIHYPIYTTEEASISRIFSRGEVFIPTSALLDDRGHVLEIFSGWSEESRAAIHRLAGAASAQERRIRE
jgi:peroxiredoxin